MDYYLEDIARLEGQPKRAIADYVEQNGILVPRRFGSLKEARESGLPIIARSEHPQDYAGASGILKSPWLDNEICKDYKNLQSEEELKAKALAESNIDRDFCEFLGYDEEKFRQDVSFSFWELLHGCARYNRAVVADSAIEGRYHIISYGYNKDFSKTNWETVSYIIAEAGSILKEYGQSSEELKAGLPALLETYEKIRHLGRFDANHCPIMEFQTVDDRNYFLQYHRTRDFDPASFVLERGPVEREVEAPFVRGITPPEGMKCKVTVHYAKGGDGTEEEDGSWDLDCSRLFSELRARKRKVQITDAQGRSGLSSILLQTCFGHDNRSMLFKPQVSLIAKFDDFFISQEDSDRLREMSKRGQNSYMVLDILSDGRRCFVKRLE
ncbi:MAG TPA: hypothetical protein HA362_05325 [Nanoarchaeota archaeon]|nr:hypothetical protein [Nanoarchaeota archaeon]